MTASTLTPGQRVAALEAAAREPGAEAAILAALEDPAASVRERAIKLAARYLEPSVLGALDADGANAVRRTAGLVLPRAGRGMRAARGAAARRSM